MSFEWIQRHRPSTFDAIHPEWRVGQYVTYFLQRTDASWTAFAITIESQTEDGAWILRSDFKTTRGESTTWFRSDPHARADVMDPVPIHEEMIRGSRSEVQDLRDEDLQDEPYLQSAHAMNLLTVRRTPTAVTALRGLARAVQYPCGIDQAHRFITPGRGYEKHHDLNPRVMITGVACLSVDDGQFSIIATSFGFNDPNAVAPESSDGACHAGILDDRSDGYVILLIWLRRFRCRSVLVTRPGPLPKDAPNGQGARN